MKSAERKVVDMVASGSISLEDGEKLLGALKPKEASRLKILFNPFEKLGDAAALSIALASLVLGAVLPILLPVRFDGALDVHTAPTRSSLAGSLRDLAIDWIPTILLLWAVPLAFKRRGRLFDFATGFGVARLPLLVVAVTAPLLPTSAPTTLSPTVLFIVFGLVVPCAIWFFVLLFQSFKTASGLTGGKLWAAFFIAVILAELGSKLLLASQSSI